MTWPSNYPPDCPYRDSDVASGVVYRLLFGDSPAPEDFRSHREMFPTRRFKVPECEACGLSVYRDTADVQRMRRRIPSMRKRALARGALRAEFGRIAPTPKEDEASHCTWWVPIEAHPWTDFEIVELGED